MKLAYIRSTVPSDTALDTSDQRWFDVVKVCGAVGQVSIPRKQMDTGVGLFMVL